MAHRIHDAPYAMRRHWARTSLPGMSGATKGARRARGRGRRMPCRFHRFTLT